MRTALENHIQDRRIIVGAEKRSDDERAGRMRFLAIMLNQLHEGMTVVQSRNAICVALGYTILERLDWGFCRGAQMEAQLLGEWLSLVGQHQGDLIEMGLIAA
jgi:hypothetical protein